VRGARFADAIIGWNSASASRQNSRKREYGSTVSTRTTGATYEIEIDATDLAPMVGRSGQRPVHPASRAGV
jgi:hypothetical protein